MSCLRELTAFLNYSIFINYLLLYVGTLKLQQRTAVQTSWKRSLQIETNAIETPNKCRSWTHSGCEVAAVLCSVGMVIYCITNHKGSHRVVHAQVHVRYMAAALCSVGIRVIIAELSQEKRPRSCAISRCDTKAALRWNGN